MSPVKRWSPEDGTTIVMSEGTKCSTYSVGTRGETPGFGVEGGECRVRSTCRELRTITRVKGTNEWDYVQRRSDRG